MSRNFPIFSCFCHDLLVLHFICLSVCLSAWQLMEKKILPESFLVFYFYEVYPIKMQTRICLG